MSTSITKQGIIFADGESIGENLIFNGNMVEFNGTYTPGATCHWQNWSSATDRSLIEVNRKYWLHYKSSESTKYGGFYQDHNLIGDVVRIKPNTEYTVSATWFASQDISCCYWFHWRSSEGGANISQATKHFNVTTIPQRISLTFTSGSSSTYTVNRFNLMIGSYHPTVEGVDVYFTDVKMEEGSIPTPWTPNPNDAIYTGEHGFFEGSDIASIGKGYVSGREFYEM